MNPRIPQIIADLVAFDGQLKATNDHDAVANLLSNIKLYAAQLYLEADMEIISHATTQTSSPAVTEQISPSEPLHQPSFTPEPENNVIPSSEMEEIANTSESEVYLSEEVIMETEEFVADASEIIEEDIEIQEFEEKELQFSQETSSTESEKNTEIEQESSQSELPNLFSDVEEEDAENEEEQISQPVENESTIIKKVKVSGENESVNHPHYEQKATEILSMFSFSRRFEFGNFLFGGDMKLFSVFITEMLAAGSADAREDVFDIWYQQRQWSRRDESANDLKRNLKKMM